MDIRLESALKVRGSTLRHSWDRLDDLDVNHLSNVPNLQHATPSISP